MMINYFQKFGITAKKTDIDFSIANKINSIFKLAISIFEDDFRFWIAYMAFCKQVVRIYIFVIFSMHFLTFVFYFFTLEIQQLCE